MEQFEARLRSGPPPGPRAAVLSVRTTAAVAASRDALNGVARNLAADPKALADYVRSDPDPVVLAALAGRRAVRPSAAVKGLRTDLKGRPRRRRCPDGAGAATYVVAVRQTLDERADRVPTAVPHRGYKPRGVMRDVPAPPARPELSAAVAAAPPIEYRTDVSGAGRDRAPMRQVDLKTADRLANEGLLNRSTARVERHLVGRAGTVAGRHAVYGAGRLLKSGGLAVAAPPVMAGVLAARAGRAGYQTTAGLREIARGTRNVARWGCQSLQRGMERVAAVKRAVVDTITGAGGG